MKELFGKKRKKKREVFDKELWIPVIKSSICTGEKVAGFQNRMTGEIQEVMLIGSDKDRELFCEEYQIEGEIKVIY